MRRPKCQNTDPIETLLGSQGGGWVVRDREEIRMGNIKSLLGNRQLT